MERDKIVKIYFESIKFAVRTGCANIAGDFASWRMVRLLEGKGLKQSSEQAIADFFREMIHNPKVKNPREMMKLKRGAPLKPQEAKSPPMVPQGLGDAARLLTEDQTLRTIIILMGKWGFFMHEVAEVLGLSEGRISQLLKDGRIKYRL